MVGSMLETAPGEHVMSGGRAVATIGTTDASQAGLSWPFTDVTPTARVLGVSRAGLYEAIRRGDAPVRTIKVGGRIKVVTASVIALLEGCDEAEVVRKRETAALPARSDGTASAVSSGAVK